jgi:uncharacterized membrane protein
MEQRARRGMWLVVGVIAATAVTELVMAAVKLERGRYDGSDVTRLLLTAWLFMSIWSGSAWARWLLAGLYLLTAALSFVAVALIATGRLATGTPPIASLVFLGIGALTGTMGLALASRWVGAFQAAQRRTVADDICEAAALVKPFRRAENTPS